MNPTQLSMMTRTSFHVGHASAGPGMAEVVPARREARRRVYTDVEVWRCGGSQLSRCSGVAGMVPSVQAQRGQVAGVTRSGCAEPQNCGGDLGEERDPTRDHHVAQRRDAAAVARCLDHQAQPVDVAVVALPPDVAAGRASAAHARIERRLVAVGREKAVRLRCHVRAHCAVAPQLRMGCRLRGKKGELSQGAGRRV
eukprot:350005-Chlamydomonas_euryale.AAC.3